MSRAPRAGVALLGLFAVLAAAGCGRDEPADDHGDPADRPSDVVLTPDS